MSNVIIIGNGPAGVSASLYTARAGVETTIIGSGLGALGKAEKIENYYGFAEPVDAKELVAAGTATGLDEGKSILVPSLVEVWRTAPYLHDGRAKTIREAITTHNPGDIRGKTSSLNDRELEDLVNYVQSL